MPAAAPVVGWRYWQVAPGEGRLRSVAQRRFVWPPGRPLRAGCVGGGHRPPAPGCRCGIYGAADLVTLRDHGLCLAPTTLVVGTVALWGTVVPDDEGYRAEYAYPRTLSVVTETVQDARPDSVAAGLAAYRVPVDVTALDRAVGDVSAAVLAYQAMSRCAVQAADPPTR